MTKLTEKQEALLKELLEDFQGNTEAVMGPKGLMNQLRKRVVEAMSDGEMTSHRNEGCKVNHKRSLNNWPFLLWH